MMVRNKKMVCIFLMLVMLIPSFVFAAEQTVVMDQKATVALLFVNNAKSTFDNDVSKKMTDNFSKILNGKYTVISGDRYIERLNKTGITDITTAERSDIVEAFKGDKIDFVLFAEVQPFIRKEKITLFTYGKDMTAIVPLKIIDLVNNKYLYNGKFTEFASDSSMIGGVGNKSVALKALDMVIEKMNAVISVRLPLDPAVKAQP